MNENQNVATQQPQWVPVNGYEGLYEVSNTGVIRRVGRPSTDKSERISAVEERYLKPGLTNKGYCLVVLSKNGKTKNFLVHRLVGLHFVPNPDNLPYINHDDTNKQNNNDWNLKWCTQKENVNHAWQNGLNESVRIAAMEGGRAVIDTVTGIKYKNITEAAMHFNLKINTLVRYLKGHRKNKTNLQYLNN